MIVTFIFKTLSILNTYLKNTVIQIPMSFFPNFDKSMSNFLDYCKRRHVLISSLQNHSIPSNYKPRPQTSNNPIFKFLLIYVVLIPTCI